MSDKCANVSNAVLREEIEAVNAIYGADVAATIAGIDNGWPTGSTDHISVRPPGQSMSFILSFGDEYPLSCPQLDGTHSTGHLGKGEGRHAVKILQEILQRIWTSGAVCLFDLIEEALPLLQDDAVKSGSETISDKAGTHLPEDEAELTQREAEAEAEAKAIDIDRLAPSWTISESFMEKKSVFIGRCARVTDKADTAYFLSNLFSTNKKVAAATHNITAWKIQDSNTGISAQNCDDDGETAAGGRLLHLMQVMDVWNVIVIVTRWYGGVKLGPDRFRLINQAARDALVKGGFVKTQEAKPSKKKGKK